MAKQNVLFICVHNSARSQMAEAWLNQTCGDYFVAQSAGLEPGTINPLVVEVMNEARIDLSEKKTQAVFDVFLGEYESFRTFFHGHSFTANQLGSAAALANLEILQSPASLRARRALEQTLRRELQTLWSLPHVGDVRQVGLVAGIELVRDWHTRQAFHLRERAGIRVCEAMSRRGVLTRPIGNVIVLMPPYCTTAQQVQQMVTALREAVHEILG